MGAHLVTVGVTGVSPFRAGDRRHGDGRAPAAERCVECDRPIDEWSCWYADGDGTLVPLCADCAARDLGLRLSA